MDKYIQHGNNGEYFLSINGLIMDSYVAKYLGLSLGEYTDILKRHNSRHTIILGECYFKDRSDIEEALKELEPYIVMATLMGELI